MCNNISLYYIFRFRCYFESIQGNSAVQIEILKTNGISSILEVLSNEDNSDLIRAKSIYALSASIRAFPAAQAEFVAKNGLGALKKAVHIRHLAKSVITLSSDLGSFSNIFRRMIKS